MSARQIKDETVFHTSVTQEGQNYFDKNSTIVIDGAKNNPRYNELINFTPKANLRTGELGWLKYLDHLCTDGKTKGTPSNWIKLLENITNITYRVNNRYAEKIFEEIRINEFQYLPSRYTCIYLADKSNIELWHRKALQQLNKPSLPIYEFKATGNVHYGDAEWLEVDIVSDEEYKRIARNYWKAEKCPETTEDLRELLFQGTLEFVKKHETIEVLLNSLGH